MIASALLGTFIGWFYKDLNHGFIGPPLFVIIGSMIGAFFLLFLLFSLAFGQTILRQGCNWWDCLYCDGACFSCEVWIRSERFSAPSSHLVLLSATIPKDVAVQCLYETFRQRYFGITLLSGLF